MDWSGQNVLITGGTGSFGRELVDQLLRSRSPERLVVFSRDETKQHEMRAHGIESPLLRYVVGDVRDLDRLRRALRGVSVVVHAAALKHVSVCEENPAEALLTNALGAQNVIQASLENEVARVIALSTDKAVHPGSVYGATKLIAERLFLDANDSPPSAAAPREAPPRFSCVRFGNLLGSRGSVTEVIRRQSEQGRLKITDERMTRFWMPVPAAARFTTQCLEEMVGGEVFVPKIASMKTVDLARALAPECAVDLTGVRPGEKIHESLISIEEAERVREFPDRYVLGGNKDGKSVPADFEYRSDTNPDWWSASAVQEWG